ncbi:hypothetical protein TrLO_g13284 [Triparma laevis f. longispina]|uniref:Uncharacterized protein n=1 Tax=Triparma laevis f. longispina TaxID=1714387 RepID=A0A9W7EDU0_9STRA|nr:hypothetical protein TrLO_g13284 [Triparma laevis f. longispina]
MACITTGSAAVYAYCAYSSDEEEREKINKFWGWIMLPISMTAMGISFALKPRREDRPYTIFLYAQCFTYAYGREFPKLIGQNFETSTTIQTCLRMGGVIVGLWQLAFLMFASIQCDGNEDD